MEASEKNIKRGKNKERMKTEVVERESRRFKRRRRKRWRRRGRRVGAEEGMR